MNVIDLVLGTRVRLRLVDVDGDGRRAVARQTGLREAPVEGTADLVVRQVDVLPGVDELRRVGPDLACTAAGVVVLPSGRGPRTLVPLAELGAPGAAPEVLCEPGLAHVPLLVELLNLAALARGLLPLHAAAFDLAGRGVVITGWSKGGKTELLLGVMAETAATFVADEWLYLDPEDGSILGSDHPVRIWDWHVAQLQHLAAVLPDRDVRRFRAARVLRRLDRALPGPLRELAVGKLLRASMPLVEARAGAHVRPVELFGERRLQRRARLDTLVHVGSWTSPGTSIEPVDPAVVAARMVFSLRREREEIVRAYDAFRYVTPTASCPWLDAADVQEERRLHRAFSAVGALELLHPHPFDVRGLAGGLVTALGP